MIKKKKRALVRVKFPVSCKSALMFTSTFEINEALHVCCFVVHIRIEEKSSYLLKIVIGMALVPGGHHPGAENARRAISIIGGALFVAISPFLVTAICIYCSDIWRFMITKRSMYLEFEMVRRRWNKVALMEQRRRNIAGYLVRELNNDTGKSEEDFFLYLVMARGYAHSRLGP